MVVAEKRDKTLCVLITGASRGIGLELVKQYLLRVGRGNYGRGGHVIACARDPDKSMDLLRCFTVDYVSYELVPLDVTDPGSFGDLHEHLQDLDRIKEMDGVAQKIDIEELYRALGTEATETDPEALSHMAGVLDGMTVAANRIRQHGLDDWARDI